MVPISMMTLFFAFYFFCFLVVIIVEIVLSTSNILYCMHILYTISRSSSLLPLVLLLLIYMRYCLTIKNYYLISIIRLKFNNI